MVDTVGTALALDDASPLLADAPRRVSELAARLGIAFNDPALLLRSLVHRSAVLDQEREGKPTQGIHSNERLEFLGDAILGLLVSQLAYARFPDYDEGRLTAVKTALVRRSTLALLAETLDLRRYLYVGRAESRAGARGHATVLAEAFEALLAAIYLDQGLDRAACFLSDQLDGRLESLLARADTLNAKSRLQELAQATLKLVPQYSLLGRSGPPHDSRFEVEVRLGENAARGEGSSKQGAEQQAARALYEILAPRVRSLAPEPEPPLAGEQPG